MKSVPPNGKDITKFSAKQKPFALENYYSLS